MKSLARRLQKLERASAPARPPRPLVTFEQPDGTRIPQFTRQEIDQATMPVIVVRFGNPQQPTEGTDRPLEEDNVSIAKATRSARSQANR